MSKYVLDLREIDKTMLPRAGGKAANLGELFKIKDMEAPEGFCITTEAYKKIVGANPGVNLLLDQLSGFKANDRRAIGETCVKIREAIESSMIPEEIETDILAFLSRYGENGSFAVRSSATAEDLPAASFAGQQDTYLNITGKASILEHTKKCWASLFTDRAVIYRIQNEFDHKKVFLSVIVQKMIFPEVAGIMFTADPVTYNRNIVSIDASFGLGEALVSGLVNADNYKVRGGEVVDKKVSNKKLAIYALNGGGTKDKTVEVEKQNNQALSDEQILRLAQLGRKIEEHFGYPQDIEWCLAADSFYIVQSRPITTLFPIPEADDQDIHIYISVGHAQMMTDAMKPLGLSVWQLNTPRPVPIAGGRLFVDVTAELTSPESRNTIIETMGQGDPLIKDALITVVERGDLIKTSSEDVKPPKVISTKGFRNQIENDPAIVADLIDQSRKAIEELRQTIQTKSGTDVFDFIFENIQQWKQSFARSKGMTVILAAMDAATWVNEKMNEWLGEKNAVDTLSQSVPNNVTSEMGLALLDVADAIRPYPEVMAFLQNVKNETFLNELIKLNGGREVREAILDFLANYGMRCPGEIDITKPRWSEKPAALIPVILCNIRNLEPNASERKFERGKQEAWEKELDLLKRLKKLPDGEQKVDETRRMISLIRIFSGYREYPKYNIVSRYFIYKRALLKEAEALVEAGVLEDKEDIYYLSFEELREVVRTGQLDDSLIKKRKADYAFFEKLTPPRVMTSEGEVITGRHKRENLPANAIAGLAVSSGTVEGRARVILNIENADLAEGDILVTTFTDPSWTPLFLSTKGLVTEVGGLMTHGAVIAREYGLPAVVGVENATRLIKDGQRIRVNGTDGYVILE